MKKKEIYLAGFFIVVILVLVGVSYAYLRKSFTQNEDNNINTLNCLDLTISDTNSANTGINLINAFPIPDAEGLKGEPYSFTVTNNCTTPILVDVNVESLSTSKLGINYVKINYSNGKDNYTSLINSLPNSIQKSISDAKDSKNLDRVFLAGNDPEVDNITEKSTKTFEIKLWINEATTWEEAHTTEGSEEIALDYHGKIVALATPSLGREYYTPGFNAGANTLLYAIEHGNYEFLSKPVTNPGNEINMPLESVIAKAEDDYGTSFYFRGNVKNNYVTFAGKCWKIVRIDGNGNIKLLLWNNNGTDCTISSAGSSAFNASSVKYNKDAGGTGSLYQTASGIGFMYGKPDATVAFSDNNTGAQDNITDSTILANLKSWYDTTFDTANTSNYTNILADVIWCGDKSVHNGDGYGEKGYAASYFMTRKRLFANNPKTPSLVCPDVSNASEVSQTIINTSRYTAYSNTDSNNVNGNGMLKTAIAGTSPIEYKYYKIGLITADEVAFAGGAFSIANGHYFIYNDSPYWTMSPSYFDGSVSHIWRVYLNGDLSNVNFSVTNIYDIRPAVSLVPTAEISRGDGTVTNPYVISV